MKLNIFRLKIASQRGQRHAVILFYDNYFIRLYFLLDPSSHGARHGVTQVCLSSEGQCQIQDHRAAKVS